MKVKVKYTWFDSPVKDYTLSVYSKQDLKVKDHLGKTSVFHMDGQEPSGFTHSSYRISNENGNETPIDTTIDTFTEVI